MTKAEKEKYLTKKSIGVFKEEGHYVLINGRRRYFFNCKKIEPRKFPYAHSCRAI